MTQLLAYAFRSHNAERASGGMLSAVISMRYVQTGLLASPRPFDAPALGARVGLSSLSFDEAPANEERPALALFPTRMRNPNGTKAISTSTFLKQFRDWVDQLELGGNYVSHQEMTTRPFTDVETTQHEGHAARGRIRGHHIHNPGPVGAALDTLNPYSWQARTTLS